MDDVSVDVKSEDVAGVFFSVFDSGGKFNATYFSSSAGMRLSFDHDGGSQSFGCADGFFDGEGNFAIGDRHSELFEELFALVFEEVHGGAPGLRVCTTMRLPSELDILGGSAT